MAHQRQWEWARRVGCVCLRWEHWEWVIIGNLLIPETEIQVDDQNQVWIFLSLICYDLFIGFITV